MRSGSSLPMSIFDPLLVSKHSHVCRTNHISQIRINSIMLIKTTQKTPTPPPPQSHDHRLSSEPVLSISSKLDDKRLSIQEGKQTSQETANADM